VAATLVDLSIDKPYSSSEQYLERWANLIETRLAKEPNLTARVKNQLAAYQRAVDGATSRLRNRSFRERQAMFRRFIETLVEDNPAAKNLLFKGTRTDLEEAIRPARRRRPARQAATEIPNNPAIDLMPVAARSEGRRRGESQLAEARKLWIASIRPAWSNAVERSEITGVPVAAVEFEKYLLRKESGGADYLFSDPDSLDEEVFWNSGYSDPQTLDVKKAETIARWGAERPSRIFAWARNAPDENVQAAAKKFAQIKIRGWDNPAAPPPPEPAPVERSTGPISRKVAAERTLFYRRVLGAWEFLLALNERPALARLGEFTELERTPLPPRKKL
jgi:hypothetical protein